MAKLRNGWDAGYEQWNERFAEDAEGAPGLVPYEHLSFWGEKFRELVMLNDHWIGYQHSEPMSLEDGMSIAFVLFDAGVDVDELIEVMDDFEPLEGAIARVGIPLCWLTDPMDHVQDLLARLTDLPHLEAGLIEQLQQINHAQLSPSNHVVFTPHLHMMGKAFDFWMMRGTVITSP